MRKVTKGFSLLKYLYVCFAQKPGPFVQTFCMPHLDYSDVIYHNKLEDLMNLVEQVQYKAALIVTGCWQRTSREKTCFEMRT